MDNKFVHEANTSTAHHCMKSHPGNRIMRDFYHQAKRENTYIPSILGLTASVDVAKIR